MDTQEVTELELIETIRAILSSDSERRCFDLSGNMFDRVPCSKRRLYAICRKYAASWGFVYKCAEYVPSGNRPFQKNHKRGRNDSPWMYRIV